MGHMIKTRATAKNNVLTLTSQLLQTGVMEEGRLAG